MNALTAMLSAPMVEEYHAVLHLYPGAGMLENTPAAFRVQTECGERRGGGWETSVIAWLVDVQIGGLHLSREQVVQMLSDPGRDGETLVAECEALAAAEYRERVL